MRVLEISTAAVDLELCSILMSNLLIGSNVPLLRESVGHDDIAPALECHAYHARAHVDGSLHTVFRPLVLPINLTEHVILKVENCWPLPMGKSRLPTSWDSSYKMKYCHDG